MTTKLVAVTLACAMVSLSSSATAPAVALRCALEAPAKAAVGQPVLLRFTLTNTGSAALQVLRWNTPFEGAWFAPFVAVMKSGHPLPFQGPMVKRAEPQAADYLRLEAGQSLSAELDLALPFDLTKPGRYQVQPRIRLIDLFDATTGGQVPRPRSKHEGADLGCRPVELTLAP